MKQYLDMLQYILDNGTERSDRTGTGTIGVFGYQNRYNLAEGFPLATTKKVFWRGLAHELLWFLQGRNNEDGTAVNIKYLQDNNVKIWDDWADEDGNLGPVYGAQWRSWEGKVEKVWSDCIDYKQVDQIDNVIEGIKKNPWGRRHIVSAWNPSEIDSMGLPPCHLLFQFNVRPDARGLPAYLDCQLYQRSADVFLGVPFNIASYALLTHMIACMTGLLPGEFIHTFGDLHIYSNHVEQVYEQLSRTPTELPTLDFEERCFKYTSIDQFKFEDFILDNYNPQRTIKAEISV